MPYFENAYALIIGVNNYKYVSPLNKAVNDALDVEKLLTDAALCGYRSKNVRCLTNQEATRDAFQQEMSWLADQVDEESTVTIFFSGHGAQNPQNDMQGYLLLHDSNPWSEDKPLQIDVERLGKTAVSTQQFTDALNTLKAQKITIFFDACQSVGFAHPRNPFFNYQLISKGLSELYYDSLTQGKGRVIIASSQPDQVSWEKQDMRNGIFTHVLLNGLRGEAATAEGVKVLDLFNYLEEQVPQAIKDEGIIDPLTEQFAQQKPNLKALKADTQNDYAITQLVQARVDSRKSRPTDVSEDEFSATRSNWMKCIGNHYNLEEFRTLCFELAVTYDDLGGEGLKSKIRELVLLMEREERTSALLNKVHEKCPEIKQLDSKHADEKNQDSEILPEEIITEPATTKNSQTTDCVKTPSEDPTIEFENQTRVLWYIKQQLHTKEPYVFITATAQMGKSYLLQEIKRLSETDDKSEKFVPNPTGESPKKWRCICIDLKNSSGKISSQNAFRQILLDCLNHKSKSSVSDMFQHAAKLADDDIRLLFLINGTEYVTEEVADYFHSLLNEFKIRLAGLQEFVPGVVAVGRRSFSAWEHSYAPKMQSVVLEPFTINVIRKILVKTTSENHKRRDSWYDTYAQKIYQCTAGHPRCIAALINFLGKKHYTIEPNTDDIFLEVVVPVIEGDILTPHNLDGHGETAVSDYQQLSRIFLELSTYRIITQEIIEIVVDQLGLTLTQKEILALEDQIESSLLVKWDKKQGWNIIPQTVRRLLARWVMLSYKDHTNRHKIAYNLYHQWLTRHEGQPARPRPQGEAQIGYIREALYHLAKCLENESDSTFVNIRLQTRLYEYYRSLQVDPGQNPERMLRERLHEDTELHELIDFLVGQGSFNRLINSTRDILKFN